MGGKVNFEALKISAWRLFFEESGNDIFEVIEWGIKVATWCHSEEFFARRDRISEILHSVPNPAQRLRLVCDDLSDDSGDEREEEEEEDHQKQEKEESGRQEWEEDDQKQGKEESGRQEWEESVLVSTTAADSSCRRRVIKMNQPGTATKLVGLPAAEEGTKVTGTTCNDQKLKEKPVSTIVEGGAFIRKTRSDYSVPKEEELKPVCMSEEKVKMKAEAIKRKLRQQYLEAEQEKKRRIQVNLRAPRGFR